MVYFSSHDRHSHTRIVEIVRILHISDTHGQMLKLEGDFDLVVHTGDFCPNKSFGIGGIEVEFQNYWMLQEAVKLDHSWWKAPLFCTPGNHDYIDVTPYLREVGIDAQLLVGLRQFQGLNFYGFPWTPTFYDWNWMCGAKEMEHRMGEPAELMSSGGIDIFAAHGPMYGVLDRNREGERCGSSVVRRFMQRAPFPPKLFLHGHIHEAAGETVWGKPGGPKTRVSNAARTQRIVEI